MSRPILRDIRGTDKRIAVPASSIPNSSSIDAAIIPLIYGAVMARHVFLFVYWTALAGGAAGSVIQNRFSGRWTEHPTLGNVDGAGAALADSDSFNGYRYFTDLASGASVGFNALTATGASIAAGGKYRTVSFINLSTAPGDLLASPFLALNLQNASNAYTSGTVYVEYVVL